MTRRGGNTIGLGAGMFIGAWVLLLGILTVHFSGWLDEREAATLNHVHWRVVRLKTR